MYGNGEGMVQKHVVSPNSVVSTYQGGQNGTTFGVYEYFIYRVYFWVGGRGGAYTLGVYIF